MPGSIALALPTSLHYGREIILGAQSFLRAIGYTNVSLAEPTLKAAVHLLQRENLAGVIVMAASSNVVGAFAGTGVPTVNTSSRCPDQRLPSVLPDNIAVGRLAAEHFLQKGFRHFAICSSAGMHFAELRAQGFRQAIVAAGFAQPLPVIDNIWAVEADEWLRSLKYPCGVMAVTDHHGMALTQRCQQAGLRVPQDIAIVGVDNDEVACTLATVPLSSVDPNARQLGLVAAQVLERIIRTGEAPAQPILVLPETVVVRASSDVLAVDNADVAAALRYIQDHACDPMRIDQMAEDLAVSRRTLERQFNSILKFTIHDEIRRVRLERARQMLLKTTLKIPEIARRCGFMNSKRFSADFRRFIGMTPSTFRQNPHLRDENSTD